MSDANHKTPPRPPWKPHAPPHPEWPPHVVAIYENGCRRIDELREQMSDDGICPIPFRCYSCDEQRADLGLVNGDGVPMCLRCIGGMEAALEGVTCG